MTDNRNYIKSNGVVNALKQASQVLHQTFFQFSDKDTQNNNLKYLGYARKHLCYSSFEDASSNIRISNHGQSKSAIAADQDLIKQEKQSYQPLFDLLSQVRFIITNIPKKRRPFLNLLLYYTLDEYENNLKHSSTFNNAQVILHDQIIDIIELALNQEKLSDTQFLTKTLPNSKQFSSQEKFDHFLNHFLAFDSKLKFFHLTNDEKRKIEDNMTSVCLLACCMNTSFLTPENYRRIRKYENRMLSHLDKLSHDKDYYTHITIRYIRNNLYKELTQAKIIELFHRASQSDLLEPLLEFDYYKTKKKI